MDSKLKRELAAIERDRTSGAAELALRVVKAVLLWVRQNPDPGETELMEVARALLNAQPVMAPLVRLANEVALSIDEPTPVEALARSLSRFRGVLKTAPEQIARHFSQALRRRRQSKQWTVATYSYSSTVLRAILQARNQIGIVWCSEGRPALEGRRTARALARMKLLVHFTTDAALIRRICAAEALIIGADSVKQEFYSIVFENKVGTSALADRARFFERPIWVLTDTTKFLPSALARLSDSRERERPAKEVWTQPPKGVHIWNYYFESLGYETGLRVLTEKGWMSCNQLRHELASVRVSPRLKELMN